MSNSGGEAPKRAWYKRWWVWLIGAVVVIGVISYLAGGGRRSDAEQPTPAPIVTVDVPGPADEPEPVETEDAGPTDAERTAAFDQAVRDSFGGQAPEDVFASDPSLWYGWIAGTRVDGANAYVTLQVGANDLGRKDLGERAAMALSTLLPQSAVESVSWIIVEDAAGVVIDQKKPAPLS